MVKHFAICKIFYIFIIFDFTLMLWGREDWEESLWNQKRKLRLTEDKCIPSPRHSHIVQFSCSVLSDSSQPHGLQHASLPCSSPTPGSEVKSLSHVWLFAIPWTVVNQASLSMGFSRQENWNGVPLTSPKMALETNILAMATDSGSTHLSQLDSRAVSLVTESVFYASTQWALSAGQLTLQRHTPDSHLLP